MKPSWARWPLSALFALLVVAALLPSVSHAGTDELPDLQIQVVGLKPNSQRDVLVRVTNISAWWSDQTVATVQTVSPLAGQVRTFTVPDLNTAAETPLPNVFELTYTLAHDCNGDVVRATLSPGTNYAGAQETQLNNNVDQEQVCPTSAASVSVASPLPSMAPIPSSSPSPSASPVPSASPTASASPVPTPSSSPGSTSLPAGVTAVTVRPQQVTSGTTGPVTAEATFADDTVKHGIPTTNTSPALPQAPALFDAVTRLFDGAASPGTHTVTLPLDLSRRHGGDETFHGGLSSAECYAVGHSNLEPSFLVGWGEYEWFGSPCMAQAFQVAVTFDASVLNQVPDYVITRAVLGYNESEMVIPFCNGVIPGIGLDDPDVVPNCWRSGHGKPEVKPNGCVVVKVPSAEWRDNEPFQRMFPFLNDPRGPATKQISPNQWDVTEPYEWQNVPATKPVLVLPGETAPSAGFGLLLTGSANFDELQGRDDTSCVSWVTNIHLDITYTVPNDQGGFVPPR